MSHSSTPPKFVDGIHAYCGPKTVNMPRTARAVRPDSLAAPTTWPLSPAATPAPSGFPGPTSRAQASLAGDSKPCLIGVASGMAATLLDGATVAREIKDELRRDRRNPEGEGRGPGPGDVALGDDPASAVYVRSKTRSCEDLGLLHETRRLSGQATTDEVLAEVGTYNSRADIPASWCSFPLPAGRRAARARLHPALQGRRRLSSQERGATGAEAPAVRPLYSGGYPRAPQSPRHRAAGATGRGRGAERDHGQAHGPAPACTPMPP